MFEWCKRGQSMIIPIFIYIYCKIYWYRYLLLSVNYTYISFWLLPTDLTNSDQTLSLVKTKMSPTKGDDPEISRDLVNLVYWTVFIVNSQLLVS